MDIDGIGGESWKFLMNLPSSNFALTGLVWSWHLLNISRFSILWICWWRDFSRSWMWFRSVAPCRMWISISGALHFLSSYPQSEYCTSIVWTDQGPEFEREYLDVRDRAAASFQEWQEIVDEWKKSLLTRRILFSQDGMCVFSIIFPFLIVLFSFQTCVGWKILGMNWWSWGKKIGRCDRWWMRR